MTNTTFVNILYYNPTTLEGKAALRCAKRALTRLEDPFVLLPANATEVDPREWQADLEEGVAVFKGRAVIKEDVNEERDRRLSSTLAFAGHHYDYDSAAQSRIQRAAASAQWVLSMELQSPSSHNLFWIDSSNNQIAMTYQETVEFGLAATAHESTIMLAARALKDSDPIPQDFRDDKYWQST